MVNSCRLLCFLTGFLLCIDITHSFSGLCISVSSVHSRPLAVSTHRAMRLRNKPLSSLSMQDGLKDVIPGKWVLEATVEGQDLTSYMDMNPDQTLKMTTFSSISNPKGVGGPRDDRMRWKMKGTEFALEVPKRSSLSTSFCERTFLGKVEQGGKLIKGSVIDGEDEPEYVGTFELKQLKSFGGDDEWKWGRCWWKTDDDNGDGAVDSENYTNATSVTMLKLMGR